MATKSTPDGVDLKLSNYSTTAAMNGSIASANNATLPTVAANYGLKTVVDQHSLDIAARITPLEVDTKVANALLGAVTAAALASKLASQDASISGLQASKADASALTAYALRNKRPREDALLKAERSRQRRIELLVEQLHAADLDARDLARKLEDTEQVKSLRLFAPRPRAHSGQSLRLVSHGALGGAMTTRARREAPNPMLRSSSVSGRRSCRP